MNKKSVLQITCLLALLGFALACRPSKKEEITSTELPILGERFVDDNARAAIASWGDPWALGWPSHPVAGSPVAETYEECE